MAEEKAEGSPKLKRFRKPEAVGWLMAAELGEERQESSKDVNEWQRGARESAGAWAKSKKRRHREEETHSEMRLIRNHLSSCYLQASICKILYYSG